MSVVPALILATLLASCATDSAHRSQLAPVKGKTTTLDFAGTVLDFDLAVNNPGKRPIVIQGYTYRFLVAGRSFRDERVATKSNVPAGELWPPKLTLQVHLGELDQFLGRRAPPEGTVPYDLSGAVHVVDRSGNHRLPFRASGEIALLRKPEFALENLRVENPSANDARLRFDVVIKNPNVFASSFKNISIDLILEGQTFTQQKDVGDATLGRDDVARVPLSLQVHFASLGPSAKFILEKKKISYTLVGRASFSTPWGDKKITLVRGGIAELAPWP